eukprot:15460410-Alexandrium_andersonii.AAC.1
MDCTAQEGFTGAPEAAGEPKRPPERPEDPWRAPEASESSGGICRALDGLRELFRLLQSSEDLPESSGGL